jgi:hypothetical protein
MMAAGREGPAGAEGGWISRAICYQSLRLGMMCGRRSSPRSGHSYIIMARSSPPVYFIVSLAPSTGSITNVFTPIHFQNNSAVRSKGLVYSDHSFHVSIAKLTTSPLNLVVKSGLLVLIGLVTAVMTAPLHETRDLDGRSPQVSKPPFESHLSYCG